MVPVVASLLLYKTVKSRLSLCLSAICLYVTPISQPCLQQSKRDLLEVVRPQSIYTYKSENPHPLNFEVQYSRKFCS